MTRDHKIIDLALEYRHETGLAYLVSNDGKTETWLPKSLVEYDGKDIFTMPEWLAKREGLL
jgi:hypothetical protein